jgi:predicted lipoprotein with Yx(FWY)xxD motif
MSERARPSKRSRVRALTLLLVPVALAGAILANAASAGSTMDLKSAHSSQLGRTIVVNSSGFTLYALSPETTHHLLCTSHECMQTWPPLTVHSRSVKLEDGSGVHGALGILKRSNGELQVTLRGMPLYRFAGDSAAHETNGEDIHSFGGTWHAAAASAGESSTPTNTSSTPSSGGSGSGW